MTSLHQMNQINLLTAPNSKSHKMSSVVERVQFHQDCNNHDCKITDHCWQSSVLIWQCWCASRKVNDLSGIIFYDWQVQCGSGTSLSSLPKCVQFAQTSCTVSHLANTGLTVIFYFLLWTGICPNGVSHIMQSLSSYCQIMHRTQNPCPLHLGKVQFKSFYEELEDVCECFI